MFYIRRWLFIRGLKKLLRQNPNQIIAVQSRLIPYMRRKLINYRFNVSEIKGVTGYSKVETSLLYF